MLQGENFPLEVLNSFYPTILFVYPSKTSRVTLPPIQGANIVGLIQTF
jgi:hypothetical protein